MSHVIQSKASALLLGCVVAISLFSFSAEAFGPGPRSVHKYSKDVFQFRNFFDPEYARTAFQNIKSFADLDNGFDVQFIQWEKESLGRAVSESMKALEKHPSKDGIKRAHDNQHLWEWWTYKLSGITRPMKTPHYPWNGWNKWDKKQCTVIKFRLSPSMKEPCIVPDWRSPEMVAEDEAFLKKVALKAKK